VSERTDRSSTTPEEAQRALEDLPSESARHGTPGQSASDEPDRRKDRGEQGKPRPGTPDEGVTQGEDPSGTPSTGVPE
jgi:hypothetical protein